MAVYNYCLEKKDLITLKYKIHIVDSLQETRLFLNANYNLPYILINAPTTTKYYGIMVLDYIFKTLKKEYHNIEDIILNLDDDNSAMFNAIKLGYKNLIYTGNSKNVLKIFSDNNVVLYNNLEKALCLT